MRSFLEQPMRRSDFINVCFAAAGAFFLFPCSGREGTRAAEAAEGTGAYGGGALVFIRMDWK
jgi:hypothetical protein